MADDAFFTEELRVRTQKKHKLSDISIQKLVLPFALSSPEVYRVILLSFYWVYRTLEEEVETRRRLHPKISPAFHRELQRTAAFERDITYYYGEGYVIEGPSQATQEYIRELKECVERDPVLLLAYSHAMYVFLMGGGGLIKKWVRSAFRLPKGVGTAVFDAGDGRPLPMVRREFEDALNRISLSREEKERLVERKNRVYDMNEDLLKELVRHKAYKKRLTVMFMQVVLAFVFVALILVLLKHDCSESLHDPSGFSWILGSLRQLKCGPN